MFAKILDKVFLAYSILAVSLSVFAGFYLYQANKDLSSRSLIKNPEIYATEIFDNNGQVIQKIGQDQGHVSFSELPKTIIDAVVAVEDNDYFYHDGVDIHRIFGSVFNNLTSHSSLQGASTLTQQLARNLFLSSEKTLERKIKELLLSFSLESSYDKETILEFYFNRVNFDPVYPGIVYAADKFFNKLPKELSFVEAATLVGLVQSPSAFEPFKHADRANNRKNIVLKKMYEMDFITENQYNHGRSIAVEDLLYKETKYEDTLPNQAYLDAVYEEAVELVGLDPYQDELKIYTYMEPSLQSYADEIQKGNIVAFSDDLQQIGGALIKQDCGQVVALIGGRDYAGRRLFNHAYDKKVNPASTIKPVFEYLLAVENLNYNRAKTLIDEETTYLSGESLKNAGGNYSGRMSMQDALGYSKNTTAIRTLNELTQKYGEQYLQDYLETIGLMDKGPYTESYGLGGMNDGVSLVSLAASYGVIAGNGEYINPSLIKRIERPSGEVLYADNRVKNHIVSEESSYIMKEMLVHLVDYGYNGLDAVHLINTEVGAKTGTGQYDSSVIKRYQYPVGVDKDSLVVGFSADYTLAVWTGFDKPEKDKKAYYSAGDNRKAATKKIFKALLKEAANANLQFNKPQSLISTNVVKYADNLYAPNAFIPEAYQMMTTIKSDYNLTEYPQPEAILPEGKMFEYDDHIEIVLDNILVADPVYEKIYGSMGFHLTVNGDVYFSSQPFFSIKKYSESLADIAVEIGYENLRYSGQKLSFNSNSNSFNFWS